MNNDERKVLFVHDGPMYVDSSTKKCFGIHYDDKLITRYSYLGSHISFLMRSKAISSAEALRYSPLSSSGFFFIEIPNFKSVKTYFPNRRIAKKIIETAIIDHDLIIVRLPSAAGTIAFNIARKLNKPVLVEFVACVFDALWNYDWRGKLLAHYKLYYYKRLMNKSLHTIYVTNQFLQSRYPSKGHSIGCSDVQLFSMDEVILKKRLDKIKINDKPLVMGTIGALNVPYKGQSDIIKAIGILKKEGICFKYKLVGQGNPSGLKRATVKNKVEDLVEFIGALPHNDVSRFLEEIDLYIHPSRVEGLPRALVEAMSKACPSLGANVGGIPELIEKPCVFESGDINQIVQKLKEISIFWMQKQAELNFERAKYYQMKILETRRKAFYQLFLADYNFS